MTYHQRPGYPGYPGPDPYPAPPGRPVEYGQQPARTGQHPYQDGQPPGQRGQHPYDPRETRADLRVYRAPAAFQPPPGPPASYQPPAYQPPPIQRQPSRPPQPVYQPAVPPQPVYQPQPSRPPQPVYQPAVPPPPRPPVRPAPAPGRDRWPVGYKVIAGLFAVFTVIIGVSAVQSHKSSSLSMAAATAQARSSAAPSGTAVARPGTKAGTRPSGSSAARSGTRVVATFSGSGVTNTARFTVSSSWRLDYSFNCGALGQAGNFIVMEDGSFGAMAVDELAASKTGSAYAQGDAGAHYLEIDSECSWTVRVADPG